MKNLIVPSILFILAIGCSKKTDEKAEQNFKSYCSSCHGEEMQAFVDRKWKFGNDPDSIFQTIKYGRENAGMPSFSKLFSDDEIKELVDYISSGISNVDQYKFQDLDLDSDTFKTEKVTFHLDTIYSGGDSPWGLDFLPDGTLIFTERSGSLFLLKDKGLLEVKGLPKVIAEGQGGLMDIIVHPDFSNNSFIYYSFSGFINSENQILTSTVVNRSKLSGDSLIETTQIFEALPYSTKRHHYGGKLEFDSKGFIYITVGDRGNHSENPQNLTSHCGKVHRLKDNGQIPEDNPFVNIQDAVKSIFTYGHRNPQGLKYDPINDQLWEHEHGPRGGDELNLLQAGENYGWPIISYGINYDGTVLTNLTSKPGMMQPDKYWVPSIAPSGMEQVSGSKYPEWEGNLLIGSLRFKYLNMIVFSEGSILKEELLMKNIGRVRNVVESPDGFIYISIEKPGFIFKLIPIPD